MSVFSFISAWTFEQRKQANPFIMEGRGVVPAVAGPSTSTVIIAEASLQGNYRGVITNYGVTVRDPAFDYSGNIGFSLLLGETPFYTNQSGQWTNERGSVANPWETMISFDGPKNLRFIATRLITSPLPTTVDFCAFGLWFPMALDKTMCSGE